MSINEFEDVDKIFCACSFIFFILAISGVFNSALTNSQINHNTYDALLICPKLEDYIPDSTYSEIQDRKTLSFELKVENYEDGKIVTLSFPLDSKRRPMKFVVRPDNETSYNSKLIN